MLFIYSGSIRFLIKLHAFREKINGLSLLLLKKEHLQIICDLRFNFKVDSVAEFAPSRFGLIKVSKDQAQTVIQKM